MTLLLSLYAVVRTGSPLDLSASTILIPSSAPLLLETYAGVLATQVFAKSGLRWPITRGTANTTVSARTTISITTASDKEVDYGSPRAEGYTIQTKGSTVNIAGTDSRGALYGIGRLLRSMNLSLTENYYDLGLGTQLFHFQFLPTSPAPRGVQCAASRLGIDQRRIATTG